MVQNIKIENITISDHAPVTMTLILGTQRVRQQQWRLNESLLQSPEVLQQVKTELELFFKENNTTDVSPIMIWEAHKATIRGILIKISAYRKKCRQREFKDLIHQIGVLELHHKRRATQEVEEQLQRCRDKLADLNMDRARRDLARCRKDIYEWDNKPGRRLARTLKKQQGRSYIPQIEKRGGGASS